MWVPSVPPILQKIYETVAGLKHAVRYWRGVGPKVRTGNKGVRAESCRSGSCGGGPWWRPSAPPRAVSSWAHGGGLMGKSQWKDFYFKGFSLIPREADMAPAGCANRLVGAQNLSLQ